MSAADFMMRLKALEQRQLTLESDNKWLKDALAKVLAQSTTAKPTPSHKDKAA